MAGYTAEERLRIALEVLIRATKTGHLVTIAEAVIEAEKLLEELDAL